MPASPGHSLLLIPVSVDIQSCSWDCWDLLGSESSDIETGPHRGSMWMSACLPIFVTAQTCRQIIYITLQCTDHTTSLEDNFFDFKGTTSPAPAAEYNWGLDFGCSFFIFYRWSSQTEGGKEEDHGGFVDAVKEDVQRLGLTEEDDRDRVRWRQMICWEDP